MIKKTIFLFVVVFFFNACTNLNNYSYKTKELRLFQNSKLIEKISLTKPQQKFFSAPFCVNNSYTISDENETYGKIFFEYIDLHRQCTWNGLPSSFFETSLRFELNLDSIETVENITVNSYTFKTYKINNSSFLSVIYFDSTYTNTFLIDYKGKFYTNFLKQLKADYENRFLDKKRFDSNYNKSLVQKTIIEHYFRAEDLRN